MMHVDTDPDTQYSNIPQNVWDTFVNSRLPTEFERIRRQQQNKRAKNKWNHRLSRKGYAGLLDEIGVGKFISPKMYFDTPKNSFQMRQERLNILERLDKQEVGLSDLKKKIKKNGSPAKKEHETLTKKRQSPKKMNELPKKQVAVDCPGDKPESTKKKQSTRKKKKSPKQQVIVDCPRDKPKSFKKMQSPRKKKESLKQ
ncbi:hypothetical protein WN944_006730 [Citrus x changshan-huyou]|uniref:Uncharacterized protein n=1 Tax=Citrus x changshan-huyou TaxID=2935761 RepID=A0AAP0MPH9_9ROSI